jgi:serine/threonine protein phosphatase PrpC
MEGFSMKTKLLLLMASFLFSVNAIAVPVQFGMATAQNKRDYQEDRYTYASIKDSKGKRLGNFFGVYDGHGGDQVSTLLNNEFHDSFSRKLNNGDSEEQAFNSTFAHIERKALRFFPDGSTAVVAYIDKITNILHYAWVGDSRLVVYGGPATVDHKPDNPLEKKRIENAGGKVEFYGVPRVNGLAVSRSIGDLSIKRAGEGQVIATPEYGQYQLTPANEFMILASDGLWDVVGNEKANMIVKNALKNGHSCKSAAHLLKDEATKLGSGDNITVVVVQFDWNKK